MSSSSQSKIVKAAAEVSALLRAPQRSLPLFQKIGSDKLRSTFEPRHLYSYTETNLQSRYILNLVMRWILDAQRADGGIAAYYSLLTAYSESYPEVTGYIIPTLYDFFEMSKDVRCVESAERAVRWLLSLQAANGAFPGGLQGAQAQPSIFNTGQILQGLVRAYIETGRPEIIDSALAAGDWLVETQNQDGSWAGYQNATHTYYSMVSWSLAELAACTDRDQYGAAAENNLNWVLQHFRPSGWVDGIDLQGHPNYLHFIAYQLQGVLECATLRKRFDAIDAVANSAWILLRKFETNKFLHGTYEQDFKPGQRFSCLTGNAQMSCVWLRLYSLTGDLRYLNAALKINEMLKQRIATGGRNGIVGGVAGSYPIWAPYQPFRYISWGCKFFADALLLEQRFTSSLESHALNESQCALSS